MNKFFKYFLAVVLGSMVSAFFFIVGIVMFITILASTASKDVTVKDDSILVLDLNGPVVERTTSDPFEMMLSQLSGQKSPKGLNQILASIKKAKEDDRIRGIYMEAGMISTGYASIEEIRNALIDFRESGKFVHSYAPIYSQRAYYLASAADRVYLNPTGMLEFKGLSSAYTFFKGTLEKLGVEMQVFKHGEFKSAVEPFILESMSDEARLQTETYLNSMWGHITSQIAQSRNLDVESVRATAELFPTFREDTLLISSGLIDGFKYKDEVLSELKKLTGIEEEKDLNAIGVMKYADVYLPGKRKGLEKNKIAVVYAIGEIDGTSGGINSEKLSRTIRQARRDSTIKAIVLRINSPGGSGLGSEIIWREVKLAQEVKPVVVSMGDLAASGGYYIACAADTIIAHPTTLTGSIGVFGLIPNTQELLRKMGITTDRVKTNTFADMPSLDRPFTREEKELMQAYIERFYNVFLQRCADGRDTTTDAINIVGEGRVWSGENALGLDLVDKLGGVSDAVAVAARMAEIETYRVVELPEVLSPIEQIMKGLGGDARARVGRIFFGEEYQIFQTIQDLKTAYPVQARIPYEISVN
ncbi:signal peptide peptidase SppA [Alkalitalea saponilacus]|uniref:Protease-4 n=1 Tax=Alkalitalea saponilacus TaxID=889453 RepID=A0A1T5HNH8_9BACT|nr:signal peptide peptidase SppA [Alkalitalea saponilacus]ASB49329.1 signal peptide peptidase SppA [Alkalitalea saponilacus]SKC22258.1 protease-4 [Alkalitalea saponilacus]